MFERLTKYELVPETNWDSLRKNERNHHSYIVYTTCGKKILMTHANSNGIISKEVDITTLKYDKFDIIVACYPEKVKEYYSKRYGIDLPVHFGDYSDVTWHSFSIENGKKTLLLGDNKHIRQEQKAMEFLGNMFA